MYYEKLHKDTINKLQQMVNSVKITVETACGICADFVPESDDEMVRKQILDCFRAMKQQGCFPSKHKEQYNSWIAWLEKHKYTEDDLDKAYKCADEVQYRRGYEDAKKEIEKQGEQKPNYCHHEVDLSECSEEYRKAYYDGWNNCNMQHSQCKSELDDVVKCLINGMKFYYEDNEEATWGTDKWSMPVKHIIEVLEKQSEQKPADNEMIEILHAEYEKGRADAIAEMQKPAETEKETNGNEREIPFIEPPLTIKHAREVLGIKQDDAWSEEDGNHFKSILSTIECCKAQFPNSPSVVKAYNADVEWLKSIKNRVQSQPRQEWSEEDDKALKSIINDISQGVVPDEEDTNWLKSLRPQSQWKPSIAQLNALSIVSKGNATDDIEAIVSLYQDLKKLRENRLWS